MENVFIVAIILLIVGGAVAYLVKAKKRGIKCVGCPDASECVKKSQETGACSGNCGSCSCCSKGNN